MYTFYSQFSTRTDRKSVAKRAGCSKNPLFFALKISFIQWGINETITKLSWKFEENRTSGRFYFFKQKKEHKKWNPLYELEKVWLAYQSMCIHCNARGRHESRRARSASWRSINTRSELTFSKRSFYFWARKKLKGSPVVVSVATAKVEGRRRSWTGTEGCPLDPFEATDEPSGCSPSQAAIRRTMIVFNHQFGKFSHSCCVDSQTSVTRQASRQRKEPLLTEIDVVNACEVRPPPAVHDCHGRRFQTQTQTQTYLFRQDCRKSKVHYLSRLRSCEEGREQDWKLESLWRINKDRKRSKEK